MLAWFGFRQRAAVVAVVDLTQFSASLLGVSGLLCYFFLYTCSGIPPKRIFILNENEFIFHTLQSSNRRFLSKQPSNLGLSPQKCAEIINRVVENKTIT